MVAELDALLAAFAAVARRHGAHLVGGNLSAGPHLAVTVTLLGHAPGRVITRAGARPGDVLYVTGTLGAGGFAVRRLAKGRRGSLPPVPIRIQAGVLLGRVAHAMIDVSDGLLQDVRHLCRASGVAAEVRLDALPVAPACVRALGSRAAGFAATAGDDYELVAAVPPARARLLARLAPQLGCRLTPVGRIRRGRPAVHLAGAPRALGRRQPGFDHFR
jgi:thiamine-monophosphate kinase